MLITMGAAVLLIAAARLLARTLPTQNVVLIVGSLIASEIVLQAVWASSDLLWRELFFWPAMILWARIGARWILRRRRPDWNYGIWLIVVAGAAVGLVQFAFALS